MTSTARPYRRGPPAVLAEGPGCAQRGAEAVGRGAQDGEPRIGDVEHAVARDPREPAQPRVLQHGGEREPVAAEHDRVEVVGVREQDRGGDVGRGVVRDARLALPPAPVAALALPARAGCGRARGACRPSSSRAAAPRRRPAAYPPSRTSSTPTTRSRAAWAISAAGAKLSSAPLWPTSGGNGGSQHDARAVRRGERHAARQGLGAHAAAVLGGPALEPGREPLGRHFEGAHAPSSARSAASSSRNSATSRSSLSRRSSRRGGGGTTTAAGAARRRPARRRRRRDPPTAGGGSAPPSGPAGGRAAPRARGRSGA